MTSTCGIFETSREQVSCILERRRDIDPGSTAGAALCNASFGQDKSGIRWTNRDSIVRGFGSPVQGVFPILFPSLVPRIAFSVSPTGAGLCSFQQAAFEVHHRQVGTKTASNQWRFRFQTILFDHTDLLRSFQDHTDLPMHMLMQNWQKLYFTGPQLKASLPLEDLCIFL